MDTHPDPDRQYLKTDPDPPSDSNPTGSGSTALVGFFAKYHQITVYSSTVQIKLNKKDLVTLNF